MRLWWTEMDIEHNYSDTYTVESENIEKEREREEDTEKYTKFTF